MRPRSGVGLSGAIVFGSRVILIVFCEDSESFSVSKIRDARFLDVVLDLRFRSRSKEEYTVDMSKGNR